MKQRTAVLIFAAKLGLSATMLALVLGSVDLSNILEVLHGINPWLAIAWYLLMPISVALSAWRWKILAPRVPFRTAYKYTWIGVFFGSVLPGAIAGDIAKGVSLALKDSAARTGLAASIVMEKVIGLAALIVFFDIACTLVFWLHDDPSPQIRYLALMALALSLLAVLAGGMTILAALRSDPLGSPSATGLVSRLTADTVTAVAFYRRTPQRLLKAFGLSVLIHLVNIFATWLSFQALSIQADLLFAAIIYPVLSVMLLIPISISGIGVRDMTLAGLFGLFGLPLAAGVALSWLALLATIPNLVIGGGIQLWEMYRRH